MGLNWRPWPLLRHKARSVPLVDVPERLARVVGSVAEYRKVTEIARGMTRPGPSQVAPSRTLGLDSVPISWYCHAD